MAEKDPAALATIYFDSWSANDVAPLRAVLADDVGFSGPLATVDGADEYAKSIAGLFAATTNISIEKRWVDGPDVLTWFQLTVGDAEPTPVASWIHTEGGKISRVRVTFDPRGLA